MCEVSQSSPTACEVSDHSLMRRLRLGSEGAATQIYLRYGHRLRALPGRNRLASWPAASTPTKSCNQFSAVFSAGPARGITTFPPEKSCGGCFWSSLLTRFEPRGPTIRPPSAGPINAPRQRLMRHAAANDDVAAFTCLKLTIDEALEALPKGHRDLVLLRMEGYDVAEIAERLGRSRRTVERMLQYARKSLSGRLNEV